MVTLTLPLARDFVPPKNFTVVDLWNIQRNSKTRINSSYLACSVLL